MENKKILLDPRANKDSNKELNFNTIIQNNYIYCEEYKKGTDKNIFPIFLQIPVKEDSIYGLGDASIKEISARAFDQNDLLEEISIYGYKLLNICKKSIDTLPIQNNLSLPTTLLDAINLNKEKIIEHIFNWCTKYGFPTTPKEYKYILDEELSEEVKYYELDFNTISKLSLQFIIIYLLNKFYIDIIWLQNQYEYLFTSKHSFSNENLLILKRITKIGDLLALPVPRIIQDKEKEFDEFKVFVNDKSRHIHEIFKNLVPLLNNYSEYFYTSSSTYFSYTNHKLVSQQKYSNILDTAFALVIKNYMNFNLQTTQCITCGVEIEIITDRKYCPECARKRRPKQETINKKISKINEILEYANEYNLFNVEQFKSQLYTYQLYVSENGHSKELEKLRLTPNKNKQVENLEDFYKELRKYVEEHLST